MSQKKAMIFIPLLLLAIFAISCAAPPLRILRIVSGFVLITFIPGFAVYLSIKRSGLELLETLTVSMAISPIAASVTAWLLLMSGLNWTFSIGVTLAVSIGVVWYFAFRRVEFGLRGNARTCIVLLSILACLAVAASGFHISSAYYRMRSDSWHQAEMVYEILARGVPPLEPSYQGGMPHYYWLYQFYAVIVHKVSTVGPFEVMSIVSAQFLFLAGMSIYLLSGLFKENFVQNISTALVTIVCGSSFGYLLWIPRSMVGGQRGWAEISANLGHLDNGVLGTTSFVNNAGGVAWILAKYMHSNPMVIASVLFLLLVYFLSRYVSDGKKTWLTLSFVTLIGTLLFHTISGIAFMVICGPAAVLVYLIKRGSDGLKSFKSVLALFAVFLLALIVTGPYMYPILWERAEVQSMQQGSGVLAMLENPIRRLAAVAASSLLFIPLAIPSGISLVKKGSAKNLFFLAVIAFLLLYTLFGPGTYQMLRKFYFYSYIFIAIMGSWTLSAILRRFWTGIAGKLIVVILMAVAFLPTPAILLYGWVTDPANTPDERERTMMAEREKGVYEWIRNSTPIDAFFADNSDRTFVLVFGQRRTYQYVSDFILAWRQDEGERRDRDRVLANIYSPNDLEPSVGEHLQAIEEPVYILVRKEDFPEHSRILAKMDRYPRVFERAYGDGETTVYKVIKDSDAPR